MDVTREQVTISSGRRALAVLRSQTLPLATVLVVFALALGLRLYGLRWDEGIPFTPHPDERAILMKVDELRLPSPGDLGQLLDAQHSAWNPRWFPYGSLPLYLLKLAQSLWPGDGPHDLRPLGRAISALADAVTVLVVYALGSAMYGRRAGLLASALVALAVLHIQLSHFYAVDTLLALFTVAALYFMYRVAREGRLRDSVLAGAFIGMGLATKVSQAPIYLAFLMAHLLFAIGAMGGAQALGPRQRSLAAVKGLAWGAAASLAVFFVAEPYAFLDWSRFFSDVVEQSEMVRRIRDYPYTRQYIGTTPYLYHVWQLATWGLGWPLGLAAWAGLLYVSLRGLRPDMGLAYLLAGWGVPVALLLFSSSFLAILVASAIAFLALLATLPFRPRDSRADALLLSWAVPYFLITGAFQVKFLRYLLPLTPFLLLFASRLLFDLWDWASRRMPTLRPALAAGLLVLVGATAFYALAYLGVYRQPHTAVRASQWLNRNAPAGSVILKEHWEEGLPGLESYRVRELPMYDDDRPEKLRLLAGELSRADYLVFFSNRLYGTISRLPERYPDSLAYYRLLFSGALGYELVEYEATYPELLGVSFVDDTFGRPGLPAPGALRAFSPSPVSLGLGYADESFTVYDHPKVMVFRNTQRLSAQAIQRAIEQARASGPDIGLMLSPGDLEAQQRGGTWAEIVRPEGWPSRLPVLGWLVMVEGMALLALPIAFAVAPALADRGYLLAKALGLLLVGLATWLLASLHWMAFSRASISVALLALAVPSALLAARQRRELADFLRRRWPALLAGEAVFLAAFFAFLLVRMANPDLWHPYRGGEKPMEMAYLNAVLRSTYMPPYDPWFAGGYINYYYWGQFLVALLIKATGIDPAVAFNLAVPLFFALTAAGAYAVVYNLAESTRRRAPLAAGARPEGGAGAVFAGVVAALFVCVAGNLDGMVQVGEGVWRAMFQHQPFGAFDFWRSSRMMPPDPPGHEITEFPFFTFLFADLHAHLLGLPFTLLALGLSLAVALRPAAPAASGRWEQAREVAALALLGVAVGALRPINTWDFPTYLLLAGAGIFLGAYFRNGGLGLMVLLEAGVKSLFVFAVGYVAFLPFHLSYETFFNSLEATTNRTVLWQFLGIHSLPIFIIGSFLLYELRDWLAVAWRVAGRRLGVSPQATPALAGGEVVLLRAGVLAVGGLLAGYAGAAIISGVAGSTIPFLVVLLVLTAAAGLRWLLSWRADAPQLAFVAAMVGLALALAAGLDLYRLEGDIDRMNSVFKFYMQVWVLLALASAYLLWRLARGRRVPIGKLGRAKKAWLAALALLLVSVSVYPIMGTQVRLRDRFDPTLPLSLDGTAYMRGATYFDEHGPLTLSADYVAIRWLQQNVQGSPVVLEGNTPTYRWGGRVSIYTGLPSVVGWEWHQEQQRWDYRWAVGQRIEDVHTIYRTTDATEALELLRRYRVRYVYLGQLERLYYPGAGLDKFEGGLSGVLRKVYQNEQVAIYEVLDSGARG